MKRRAKTIEPSPRQQQSHRRAHLERVEANAASAVDVGMVNGRNEAHLWRFERIPGVYWGQ